VVVLAVLAIVVVVVLVLVVLLVLVLVLVVSVIRSVGVTEPEPAAERSEQAVVSASPTSSAMGRQRISSR
jgi:flagellar basal body-associated protein FliL